MSETKILPGWFAGTCTNTTVNQTANLLLRIYGATDFRMHGELGVYGNLDGGGSFHRQPPGPDDRRQLTLWSQVQDCFRFATSAAGFERGLRKLAA
jgi:hypothetical protein